MWVQIAITVLIVMLLLLVWQRWKVSTEWLRMERELSDEEYEIWKSAKLRDAESWAERWKGVEAGFLFILSAMLLGLWFLI
ncbi:MAG: hypothetical protein OSB32_04635 [Candidatus Poseidoniales archaeon]|nr:hypothetical protein [Candidatus Poseidoniales archaeon]